TRWISTLMRSAKGDEDSLVEIFCMFIAFSWRVVTCKGSVARNFERQREASVTKSLTLVRISAYVRKFLVTVARGEQLLPTPRTQRLRIGNHDCAGFFSWQTASLEAQRLRNLPLG